MDVRGAGDLRRRPVRQLADGGRVPAAAAAPHVRVRLPLADGARRQRRAARRPAARVGGDRARATPARSQPRRLPLEQVRRVRDRRHGHLDPRRLHGRPLRRRLLPAA